MKMKYDESKRCADDHIKGIIDTTIILEMIIYINFMFKVENLLRSSLILTQW